MNAKTDPPILVLLLAAASACASSGDKGSAVASSGAASADAASGAVASGATSSAGASSGASPSGLGLSGAPSSGMASGAASSGAASGGRASSGALSSAGASGGGPSTGAPSGSVRGAPSGGSAGAASGSSAPSAGGSTAATGSLGSALFFSAYKDTSINMNWNTNVIETNVSGTPAPLASDLTAAGDKTITLAFATGECGTENWAGVQGADLASANLSLLTSAGIEYIVSTGGAAGSFTCGSNSGFQTFVGRWASAGLVGVDFDIEAGQSQAVIQDLLARIQSAHMTYPRLRFSLTLATLANNGGASNAQSLGSNVQDSFNLYGDLTMAAMKSTFGFDGTASTWPSYVTVNVMTMDYGSPSAGVCVVSNGACEMGQSAIQAAYNLHDKWGVPYSAIELTPMIGQNDAAGEQFTLQDADLVSAFAVAQGLAGVHYWSYDRDVDCPMGAAADACNSMGAGYAGIRGYLTRLLKGGL
jgi:chitinase